MTNLEMFLHWVGKYTSQQAQPGEFSGDILVLPRTLLALIICFNCSRASSLLSSFTLTVFLN